jgi:hypothetical protein
VTEGGTVERHDHIQPEIKTKETHKSDFIFPARKKKGKINIRRLSPAFGSGRPNAPNKKMKNEKK